MNRLCHVLLNGHSGRRDIRSTIVVAGFVGSILPLAAAAPIDFPELKATDFAPLTAIPWDQTKGSDEVIETPEVLAAIYREPNLGIRYRLLEEYLRMLPMAEMEAAFKLCLPFEGTDTPDDLVAFFIKVWTDRDPKSCWEWVKRLFAVAGLESDALDLDSWTHEVRVHDLEGVRASSFWIDRAALKEFPLLINRSKLPPNERVEIMKEFADRWFAAFGEWPGLLARDEHLKGYAAKSRPDENLPLLAAFRQRLVLKKSDMEGDVFGSVEGWHSDPAVKSLSVEVLLRRILIANPLFAPELAKKARATGQGNNPTPSDEFLLLWARTDLAGMVRWVNGLSESEEGDLPPFERLEVRSKGVLLTFVDATTRERWLSPRKGSEDEKKEQVSAILESWAKWDLRAAILWMASANAPEAGRELANQSVYGWSNADWRRSRYAFQVLSTFDFSKLPPAIHEALLSDAYSFMEQWDSMDVAAAVKFGLAYLLRTNYAPRERLAAFFSGNDTYGGEDGMIDRTFCAMRLWAVVRPGEMKEWIKSLPDDELRKALFWLVEHPFGKAPNTGEK